MDELPSFSAFARQLNTIFTAQTAHGPVEMKLTEAKELSANSTLDHFRVPFSLIFINHNQPKMILSQGTYQLDHPVLGQLSLFVVPVISGRPAPDYQVVIN